MKDYTTSSCKPQMPLHVRKAATWVKFTLLILLCTTIYVTRPERLFKIPKLKLYPDHSTFVALTARLWFVKKTCPSEKLWFINNWGGTAGSQPTLCSHLTPCWEAISSTPDHLNKSESTKVLMAVTQFQILNVLLQVGDRKELGHDTSGQHPLWGLISLTRNHCNIVGWLTKMLFRWLHHLQLNKSKNVVHATIVVSPSDYSTIKNDGWTSYMFI